MKTKIDFSAFENELLTLQQLQLIKGRGDDTIDDLVPPGNKGPN